MKISVNWLKNYVDIDGISLKELADGLTLAGLEVEGIESSERVSGVVTAKVLEKEKHPNADKLSLCTVTDGKETVKVVCGAPNVAAGQIVAFASLGARLPGITIKAAKIRGVESCGMLCSERELGLTDEHSGILVLPEGTDLGLDINDVLGLGDAVFELNVTPNRPDLLSAVGVAREAGAVFSRKVNAPSLTLAESPEEAASYAFVKVEEPDKCPVYTGRIIKGIKIGPSPLWMQNRLKASGIRAINNVVDVTNYVLMEYGQPLHAFDMKRVKNGITVRSAVEGEKIVTLDGKERTLDGGMLVIADDEKALAVAGVMGGEFSGVAGDTDTVFLECAYFAPDTVRRTSKKLGLSSDSSYRYERGIDRGAVEALSDYSAALMARICGGEVLKGRVGGVFKKYETGPVISSVSGINALLGTDIKASEMADILNGLGIVTSIEGDRLVSAAPSFRVDIERPADIAEEVGRIYGYDRIETTVPPVRADAGRLPAELRLSRGVRARMEALGFNEAVNFSFMGGDYLSMFDGDERFVKILNPISADMAWMRTYVFPGILKNLKTNWNQGETDIRLFEISASYVSRGADKLAEERPKFALGVMGSFMSASWIKSGDQDVYFYLKGVLDNIFSFMRIKAEYKRLEDRPFLHPGKSAEISCNGRVLGFIGALHPDFAEKLDMKAPAYLAEIDFALACEISEGNPFSYAKFSRFPSVERDLAVVVPSGAEVGPMLEAVREISTLISDIRLFDVYSGKGVEEGCKSAAFRITFSDLSKTLSEEDINPQIERILEMLAERFGAKLR